MPTVTIDTSAELGASAASFLVSASGVLAAASGAPREHVHIQLRTGQLMTWGSKVAGVDGVPHTAQIRVMTAPTLLDTDAKNAVVFGVGALLAPSVPKASTQFIFGAIATEAIAIDGLLLPDLIARDAPAGPD
eukprot:m.132471 g.132471  ORF g.132471 m.132471 type:complete len:133 (+) comp22450_c0_seq2:211-609(+)